MDHATPGVDVLESSAPHRPSGVRVLAVAHLAFAAAFGIVVALYFGRMWAEGADRAAMIGMQHDPKDMVPFGLHGLNPFSWLYAAVSLLFHLGYVVSPALLTITVPLAVLNRGKLSRLALAVLVTAIATAVVLPVLRLTPVGSDVTRWWLD